MNLSRNTIYSNANQVTYDKIFPFKLYSYAWRAIRLKKQFSSLQMANWKRKVDIRRKAKDDATTAILSEELKIKSHFSFLYLFKVNLLMRCSSPWNYFYSRKSIFDRDDCINGTSLKNRSNFRCVIWIVPEQRLFLLVICKTSAYVIRMKI